jgi:hypothetical protein
MRPPRELVVVPDAEDAVPTQAPASPASGEEAVDVLNRLVEPVGVRQDPTTADPSVIRARLARTAALKKPGSRERREENDERGANDGR